MAVTTAAVVGAAATVGGAISQRRAADKAVKAQTKATDKAIEAQQSSEERAVALQRPFFNAGYAGTAAMLDLSGIDRSKLGPGEGVEPGSPGDLSAYKKYNFQQDPGYRFRMDEGIKAIDRSAAARGILNSGGQLRRLTRYGQDYASNEYQNVYNRIAQIAGFGTGSSSQASNTIVNTGANIGGALINAGEARASGFVASGNAIANSLSQGAKGFGFFANQSSGPKLSASDAFNRSIAISNAFNG